jgi:hypothetical protein
MWKAVADVEVGMDQRVLFDKIFLLYAYPSSLIM